MPRCVIPGCKRRHSSTHFFPKDLKRRQQWVEFVRRFDPSFEIKSTNSCICGAHFETRFYNFNFWLDKTDTGKGQRRTLSEEAVPTIPGESVSPGRSQENTMVYSELISGSSSSLASTVASPLQTTYKLVTVASDEAVQNKDSTTVAGKQFCLLRTIAPKAISSSASFGPQTTVLPIGNAKVTVIKPSAANQNVAPSLNTSPQLLKKVLPTSSQAQVPKLVLIPNKTQVNLVRPKDAPQSQITPALSKKILALKPDGGLISLNNNTDAPRKMLVKKTLLSKKDVMLVPEAEQSAPPRHYTLEELGSLTEKDLVHLFARKVKILSSDNFALRCQLVKTCRFIISCRSEADCRSVIGMHMKKHIQTLSKACSAARSAEGEKSTSSKYVVQNGKLVAAANVRNSSANLLSTTGKTMQSENLAKSASGLQSGLKPIKLTSKGSVSYTLNPQKMALAPSNVQTNSLLRQSQLPTQSTSSCTRLSSTTQTGRHPTVLSTAPQLQMPKSNPKQSQNNHALSVGDNSSTKYIINATSSLPLLQTIPSVSLASLQPINLIPLQSHTQANVPNFTSQGNLKQLQNNHGLGVGDNSSTKFVINTTSSLPLLHKIPSGSLTSLQPINPIPVQSHTQTNVSNFASHPICIPLPKPKLLPNKGGHWKADEKASSAAQNMTSFLLPLAKLKEQGHVRANVENRSKQKVLKEADNATNVGISGSDAMELCKDASNSPERGDCPLAMANQMIRRAKTLLDENSSHQVGQSFISHAPEIQDRPERSASTPPFELKITLPRLYDLAKHVIMNNPMLSGIDLKKALAKVRSSKSDMAPIKHLPTVKSEPLNGIETFPCVDLPNSVSPNSSAPESVMNVGDGNDCDSIAEKENFLAILGLEKTDFTRIKRKRKRSHTPWTRFRKKKLGQLGFSVPDKSSVSNTKIADVSQPLASRKPREFSDSCSISSDSKRYYSEQSGSLRKRTQNQLLLRKMQDNSKNLKYTESLEELEAFPRKLTEQLENEPIESRTPNKLLPSYRMLPPGMVVLKRPFTCIPDRTSKNSPERKKSPKKKYREILVNGEVVKIKQEPTSDDEECEANSKPSYHEQPSKKRRKTYDEMLQPPSDDEGDLFWDFPDEDRADSTDSESEDHVKRKENTSIAKESSNPISGPSSVVTITSVGGRITQDSPEIREKARKYVKRLLELIDVRRKVLSVGGKWPGLPESYNNCKLCSKEFFSLGDMYIHYRIHAGEKLNRCVENCSSRLYSGVPGHRPKPSCSSAKAGVSSKSTSNHACTHCGRGFRSEYLLLEHMYVHDNREPYKCNICYRRFKTIEVLHVHSKEEHDCKPISLASDDSFSPLNAVPFCDKRPLGKASKVTSTSASEVLAPVYDSSASTTLLKAAEKVIRTNGKPKASSVAPSEPPSDTPVLECHSPPLPETPPHKLQKKPSASSNEVATPNGIIYLQPVVATPVSTGFNTHLVNQSNQLVGDTKTGSFSIMQPIKLTLFPKGSSGLSRVCFAKNGKLS